MDMGTQGSGRKRLPNRERLTAEDDALNQIAREAEARLAAKRAARAEAREIRMKELEHRQKEIYQVQKKYYGLDTKWGDIEQWMEDSERYSRRFRRNPSASDEDERLSVGSRGSLRTNGYDGDYCGSQSLSRRSGRPSEYSGHLNSSSRASSRASSARASPVVEERPDKDFTEKGSRNMPSLSAATLASLGGTSSRRGSGDTSISMDTEASIREIKDSLAEVEEKYRKAMVSNAQLDNEKTNFLYQVDTLKDMLLELEEQLAESQRQYEEKNKEFEREKHAHSILQFQFAEVKEALRQREEMLEKHGIILNSEIATNGETLDTLNDVGHQAPTKMTKEELNALKSAGEGTLGKAKEVEVKKEIVENVGTGGTLQNTEQEQPRPNPVKDCVDKGVSHPGENAEDQKPAEDSALSPGPLAGAKCEVDGVICTDSRGTGGNPTEKAVQAGGAVVGEQVDTVASGPLEHSEDTVSHDGRCMNDGVEQSSEGELTQEVAKPEAGGENAVTKTGDTEVRDKKPIQVEVQATPGAPIVQSGHQDTTDPGSADVKHVPLDAKEPNKEKSEQQAEAVDSPQRKTKNKKKKNKKKKPPASVETCRDASKELSCQNAEAGDLEEEEQTQYPDKKQAAETQSEGTENPAQKSTAESSEHVHCPEDPKRESNGKQNQKEEDDVKTQAGEAVANGDKLMPEADTAQSSGTSAEGEETEEHVTDGPADGHMGVLDQNSPQCEEGDLSPVGKRGPRKDAKRGSEEGHVLSQHPGQTVEEAVDGCSVDNSDLSGELGAFSSESGVQTREEVENNKNKEDCTMS
ncbi:leucine-rich repeat flightless-interacting protein 1 isoform X3 [Onychomys torridus]|uniref:leucine-rich repeat flightless-interacting protein 1 isoform X3 n=1 Tax=Onychomys torridus TaxID=38674 RepID=UPI00167FAC15|nr:leucine-rich repeat flightless-interacting protein 1 isoform X3 [Onychomys torridus]